MLDCQQIQLVRDCGLFVLKHFLLKLGYLLLQLLQLLRGWVSVDYRLVLYFSGPVRVLQCV